MMSQRQALFFTALVLIIVATAFSTLLGQNQPNRSAIKEQHSEDNPFPVVDFLNRTAQTEKRRAKGKRYDDGHVAENGSGLTEVTLFNDWSFSVPELPIALSDVIVVGTVLDAQAFLSPDSSGVYSEFNLKVGEVLKDLTGSMTVGGTVPVNRMGGRVRYPSGNIVIYSVEGQGVLRVNKRCVVFLKREEENFSILTGYELQQGKVRPLEHSQKFKKYKDTSENSLLNEIRSAVSTPSITPEAGR